MSVKKRGLGKGLDALLGPSAASDLAAIDEGDELRLLPVDLLQRSPFQPRTEFDPAALKDLADSIRAQGIVQPVLVRPTQKQDRFEIIAGERRWRAAQMAGLHEVPALIRKIDDRAAMCLSLIENIQREDLNPLEQARALSRLHEEFDMTHDAVAEAVGRSRSTVTNLLRLLELDAQVLKQVEARKIEMGHARALLALPKHSQPAAAKIVVDRDLSVRATEALVRKLLGGKSGKRGTAVTDDPDVRRLENQLSEKLGAGVSIRHQKKTGRGRLEIRYSSLNQLDGILAKFK